VFTSYLLTVSGTASDTGGMGLSKVFVNNTTNNSSSVEVLSGTSASYAVSGIVLAAGQNVINVQSLDKSGYRSSLVAVTITYSPPTWTGGGMNANWSTAANWGGTALAAGYDLAFDGSTSLTNTNDLAAGTQFRNLTFNAGAGPFILNGNGANLSGVITNNSTNAETINLSLGGAYALTKTGAGPVVLAGTNSFTGGTVITGGTLKVTIPAALPDSSDLSIGANVLTAFAAPVVPSAPAQAAPAQTAAAGAAVPSAAPSTRLPSITDKAISALLHNNFARYVAFSQFWAETRNSDGPKDQTSSSLAARDAVLADYGRA
jgi:autotransporter-associated beta strand protein